MPRGHRRRGQFAIEIVSPEGDRIEWKTTGDELDPETFRVKALATIEEARRYVEIVTEPQGKF